MVIQQCRKRDCDKKEGWLSGRDWQHAPGMLCLLEDAVCSGPEMSLVLPYGPSSADRESKRWRGETDRGKDSEREMLHHRRNAGLYGGSPQCRKDHTLASLSQSRILSWPLTPGGEYNSWAYDVIWKNQPKKQPEWLKFFYGGLCVFSLCFSCVYEWVCVCLFVYVSLQ